uniref:SPK domain-containing protein n=1 Tax=Caenorhabditis tropicalis TaxID=1561998 RepID=A0A1I7TW76_9PELO
MTSIEQLEEEVFRCSNRVKIGFEVKASLKWLSQAEVPFYMFENAETEKYASEYLDSEESKIAKYAKRVLKNMKRIKRKEEAAASEEPVPKMMRIEEPSAEDESTETFETKILSNGTPEMGEEYKETDVNMTLHQPNLTLNKCVDSVKSDSPPKTESSISEDMFKSKREMTKLYSGTKKANNARPQTEVNPNEYNEGKVERMNMDDLESFVLGRPQFAARADIHFKKFVLRDFSSILRKEKIEKPEDLSWKAWYDQLREARKDRMASKQDFEPKKREEGRKAQLISIVSKTGPPQKRKHSTTTPTMSKTPNQPKESKSSEKSPMFKIGYMGPNVKLNTAPAGKKKDAPLMAKCRRQMKQLRK